MVKVDKNSDTLIVCSSIPVHMSSATEFMLSLNVSWCLKRCLLIFQNARYFPMYINPKYWGLYKLILSVLYTQEVLKETQQKHGDCTSAVPVRCDMFAQTSSSCFISLVFLSVVIMCLQSSEFSFQLWCG